MSVYSKDENIVLSKNFETSEFKCRGANCCSEILIDPMLVAFLQKIRDHFNAPVIINSAYRCTKHNSKIGGASNSKHLYGQAADIKVDGVKPLKVAQYAESIGVKGIGQYENFVHIDTRQNKFYWYGNEQKQKSTFGKYEDTPEVNKMTAIEKRQAVADKYKTILGRNNYSQPKRDYCFKKYKDGKYYSDCSSSISYCYKEVFPDNNFGVLNTVGMYQSKKLVDVPVVIKNGVIQNPEVLRVGDMLLFAGTDAGRDYAGYVGHVEMVYKISGDTVTICGHGSGTPSTKNMNSYCKSRYNSKTSKTKLGHKGLIRVRRFIADDGEATGNYLYKGSPTAEVAELQRKLVKLGYNLGDYGDNKDGVDGDYGSLTINAVMDFQKKYGLDVTGMADEKTILKIDEALGSSTSSPSDEKQSDVSYENKNLINLKQGSWNLRAGPGTDYPSVMTTNDAEAIVEVNTNGWMPVDVKGVKNTLWLSPNAIQK